MNCLHPAASTSMVFWLMSWIERLDPRLKGTRGCPLWTGAAVLQRGFLAICLLLVSCHFKRALFLLFCSTGVAIQQGIATYHATDAAYSKRVSEVHAEQLAKGGALAPIVSGGGGESHQDRSSSGLLAGSRTARVMLQPAAWGQVQIRDTTFVHEWPVTGNGLLPRTHPAVREVAEKGERVADAARGRCVALMLHLLRFSFKFYQWWPSPC
jgi:hypothetical protein